MFSFLIAVEVIVSILLILVILMQSSKGGGLAGTFGGASVGMVFGVRRTADFLTRATQILAVVFGLLSLVINIWFLPRSMSVDTIIQRSNATAPMTPQLPPAQLPEQTPAQQPTPNPGPGGQ